MNFFEKIGFSSSTNLDIFNWPTKNHDTRIVTALAKHVSIIRNCDSEHLLKSVDSNRPFSKLLFQKFFPKTVRHHLGEFYTPKWLVQMTIKQSFKENKAIENRRFIDPGCGSGAFLVELIRQLSQVDNITISNVCGKITGIYEFESYLNNKFSII